MYLGKSLENERHYHEALKDRVFDPIRETPDFIELMKKAEAKFERGNQDNTND